jgi:hypothetical protein
MGNNASFTIWEECVMGAATAGLLTPALLDVLSEPHRDSDIDTGGMAGLTLPDGRRVYEVVLDTAGIQRPPLPAADDFDDEIDYHDVIGDLFCALTKDRWGWR